MSFPPPCFLAKARMEVVGNPQQIHLGTGPDEAMTVPPTKTFGGDNFEISSRQKFTLQIPLRSGIWEF